MSNTVIVRDETTSGKTTNGLVLEFLTERITVRELIRFEVSKASEPTQGTSRRDWRNTASAGDVWSEAAQRFAHAGGGYQWGGADDKPVPRWELPPLVFSEVMRDVDLFVGVSSNGNDATWQDGGPHGRYVDYRHSDSFGDLLLADDTKISDQTILSQIRR